MKKLNRDQLASVVLKYLLHLLLIGGFYWALLYTTTSVWLDVVFYKVTKLRYGIAPPDFTEMLYILLLIYTLFCYVANHFLLDIYHRKTAKQFIISTIVDFLIIPFEIFLMVIYNNITVKDHLGDINTVYNVYLITALLVIKNIIAVTILSKKTSSEPDLNYKVR
jgi:apolipoprotein N-acyltransferase